MTIQSPVRLRTFLPADFDFAYSLAMRDPEGWRWRYRGVVPQPSEFERGFFTDVAAAFVVCLDDEPAGLAFVYGLNLRDQVASLAVQLASTASRTGLGIEAAAQLASYAFERWPIRKLMLEVPEYNVAQFASALTRFVTPEGRLREHVYFRRRYWDLVILSLTPSDLEKWSAQDSPSRPMRDLDELLARMGIECSGLADETMTTALGLDSLHMAEIVSHVEVCRGRSVHPDALQGIATLGEFRAWYRDVSGSPI